MHREGCCTLGSRGITVSGNRGGHTDVSTHMLNNPENWTSAPLGRGTGVIPEDMLPLSRTIRSDGFRKSRNRGYMFTAVMGSSGLPPGFPGTSLGGAQVRDHLAWICHVLRREAEGLVLPKLPAFRRGERLEFIR